MSRIHPSSIVDPQTRIAEDVVIGPWCDIEGEVTIGRGTRLIGNVWLRGPLTIGCENVIYPGACIGFSAQHRQHADGAATTGVNIGDGNIIRENVTINAATGPIPTRMRNRNYMMAGSHLGHDALMGNDCTLVNNAAVGGHAEIHDQVTLGGHSGVHQFCRVGRLSMLSAAMLVVQDLPPFCTCYNSRKVGSLNLVGLRRAGYRQHIRPLQQAFQLLYREHHTMNRALELIETECGEDQLVGEIMSFIRASRRGITRAMDQKTAVETVAEELAA